MPALLALIPVKDWIYGGIIVALLAAFGWYTVHERHEGAAHEVAALQKSSTELNKKADEKIAALTAAHAKVLTTVVQTYDTKITANNSQHESDNQRLREYDAYRRSHASISSAAQPPGTANTGTGGASQDDERVERLGQLGSNLADAARDTLAALGSCMAERDSVTSH